MTNLAWVKLAEFTLPAGAYFISASTTINGNPDTSTGGDTGVTCVIDDAPGYPYRYLYAVGTNAGDALGNVHFPMALSGFITLASDGSVGLYCQGNNIDRFSWSGASGTQLAAIPVASITASVTTTSAT